MSFVQLFIDYYKAIGDAISATWWFALPIAFFYIFKILYTKYVWREYKSTLEWSLIEIKPPRNIERSPRIMEQVFAGLHGVISTPSIFDMYFKGKINQPMFMFEIRGVNGEMHFYARMEKKFRNLVEAMIYAQYPEAEIEEVEDYTLSVPANVPNAEWDMWGSDFEFARPDAYPIRTYHKFQEDVTKGMIDPLASLADMIAGLPPGVEAWIQFLLVPVKDKDWEKKVRKIADKLAGREIKEEAFVIIRFFQEAGDILLSSIKYIFSPVEEKKEEKKEEQPLQFRLTPVEKDVLQAVEESFSKKAYFTKIRFLVLGPREIFREDIRKSVLGFFFQFNDPNLNSLKTNNDTKTYANYFFVPMRKLWAKRKIFIRYVTRDNDGPNMYLNTEELATMYHMPDMSAMSPAISRIEAKKSGPPTNLPIE
jgi:hypothetical protein